MGMLNRDAPIGPIRLWPIIGLPIIGSNNRPITD